MSGTVLIACDLGEPLSRVVAAGAGFAKVLGARPILLHVDPHPPLFIEGLHSIAPVDLARMQADYRERAFVQMRSTAAALGVAAGAEVLVKEGRPDVVICETAREAGCEAIVVGAEQHGPLEHLLVGRTALRVIRDAPCAVLTAAIAGPWKGIERVVYATDLSHEGLTDAEAWAARLAGTFGAELAIVHVSEAGSSFRDPYVLPVPHLERLRSLVAARFEAARARIAAVASEIGGGPSSIETHLLFEEDPAAGIARIAARDRTSMVVMGTRARRGLARALLGSVAEGVLRRSATNVLTVREREG